MLSETHVHAKGLADLPPVHSDSLLALIAMANADPRPHDASWWRIRDAGVEPRPRVMKKSYRILLETQSTSPILEAPATAFAELIRPILLGPHADDERIPDADPAAAARSGSASSWSRRQI